MSRTSTNAPQPVFRGSAPTSLVALLGLLIATGCGGNGSNSANTQPGLAPPPPPAQINSYFGTTGDVWSTAVNHTAGQVNGEDRTLHGVQLSGQVVGAVSSNSGFLELSLTTVPNELTGQTIGFALEVPGRLGLLRYGNIFEPLIPLAPSDACTGIGGTVTYQYVTLPGAAVNWAPNQDTAYGTFQVMIDGANWNFSNVTQFTLSGSAPANPGSGLPTGNCGIGLAGHVVTSVSSQMNPPLATATMGFAPTGFFMEDNGSAQATPMGVVPSNALGAGVGAIGLLQPAGALDTSNVVAAQYLGFYYEPGIAGGGAVTQLASFGCSGTACPPPPSQTAIVGGVFPHTNGSSPVDEPDQPPAQNVTLDLGMQDASRNGLYPSAIITISGVMFPAVAVVSTLEQKYAIFVLAQDSISNVPLGIYLFQQ
jgi:hypothetical protein